jgi:uncharacterized OsmC-like protein
MGKSFYQGTRKEMHVSEVAYISRIKVEPVEGKIRRAYLPVQEEPVLFGVHGEVAEHYGVSPAEVEPYDTTLDYFVAATGGWLLGTFRGALAARQVSFNSLYADTVGEIETENKVLVIKRIRQIFHLTAAEKDREKIERTLKVYAAGCPVARSIQESIEITSALDLTAKWSWISAPLGSRKALVYPTRSPGPPPVRLRRSWRD